MAISPTMNFRWLKRPYALIKNDVQTIEFETVLQQQFYQLIDSYVPEWRDVPIVDAEP